MGWLQWWWWGFIWKYMELTSGCFFFAVHTRNRLYIAATYPDSLGWSKPGAHGIMEIIHEFWWVAWFHLQYTCCIPVYPHEILVFLLVFEKTSFGPASLVSVDSLKSARSLRVLDIDAWWRFDFFFWCPGRVGIHTRDLTHLFHIRKGTSVEHKI